MPASLNDISSIIPRMIFGVVLIIAWAPIIVLTEINNKGNSVEFKLLLDKIKTSLKLTDVSANINFQSQLTNILSPTYYTIKPEILIGYNNNLLITGTKTYKTIDANGKEITNTEPLEDFYIGIPLVNGIEMDKENYKYLALYNKVLTDTKVDNNITYNINIYSIPANKQILKVEGLKEFEKDIDMTIYDYEFGPTATAIETIKNRKIGSNILQMWLGRLGTFLMLFGGLSLLVSPFSTLVELGETLPGPLRL